MPPDAGDLDEVELFGFPADAPCTFGFVRMNLLTFDVPLVFPDVPDVPVAEGSCVEA